MDDWLAIRVRESYIITESELLCKNNWYEVGKVTKAASVHKDIVVPVPDVLQVPTWIPFTLTLDDTVLVGENVPALNDVYLTKTLDTIHLNELVHNLETGVAVGPGVHNTTNNLLKLRTLDLQRLLIITFPATLTIRSCQHVPLIGKLGVQCLPYCCKVGILGGYAVIKVNQTTTVIQYGSVIRIVDR